MASTSLTRPVDEVDDFSDYGVNLQDVFRDVDVNMDIPTSLQAASANSKSGSLELGIDEEIKILKKRQTVPKFDENRLLSQAGIPKLRRLAKDRLKFKGKNHEYSDIAFLMNMYQLWLDDLYPRAKFADGLAMIEKLGHSKRIQVMRREWIGEGKPRERFGDTGAAQNGLQKIEAGGELETRSKVTDDSNTIEGSGLRRSSTPNDDDLYVASPPRQQRLMAQLSPMASTSADINLETIEENGVPEDDLDALLADTTTTTQERFSTDAASRNQHKAKTLNEEHDFDAEMEVMAEMDDLW